MTNLSRDEEQHYTTALCQRPTKKACRKYAAIISRLISFQNLKVKDFVEFASQRQSESHDDGSGVLAVIGGDVRSIAG